MKKSGLADSPFFASPPKGEPQAAPAEASTPVQPQGKATKEVEKKSTESRQPGKQVLMHASNHASMDASTQEAIVELIRKAVKDVGKESATYRFTPEEKKALLELTFTYKVQGCKTSENELTRIAINFILEDHKQNGRNSILDKVLQALNG